MNKCRGCGAWLQVSNPEKEGYAKLLENEEIADGEEINVAVPTGNFGNILAAYYAKQMGVPIAKLICASNENKVLFDFFETGTYDKNREFVLTSSPSMDILISSNLERLIYTIAGADAEKDQELMDALKTCMKSGEPAAEPAKSSSAAPAWAASCRVKSSNSMPKMFCFNPNLPAPHRRLFYSTMFSPKSL